MTAETARALVFAVRKDKVSFIGSAATGRFEFGGHYARPEDLDGLLRLARREGLALDEDQEAALMAMIPAADYHPLGRVIETRTREVESAGFLGTGYGTYTVREALVELAAEWEDWSGQFIKTHPAGSRVWVKA